MSTFKTSVLVERLALLWIAAGLGAQKVLKYENAGSPAEACMQKPPLRERGSVKIPPVTQSMGAAFTEKVRGC
jgi:hypothetical protein